jgi:hypothetical protein
MTVWLEAPAFSRGSRKKVVIPAQAGIHAAYPPFGHHHRPWIGAGAGMTKVQAGA